MKEIKWEESPNFSSRKGKSITGIILHHTGKGGLTAAVSWFKSKDSKVSAHYVVDVTGDIVQMVKEENKAWHAGEAELFGEKDVNGVTIGIEIVGDGVSHFTDEQYQSIADLCNTISAKYNIDKEHIVGHNYIAPGRKQDPTPFNWFKLGKLLK